MPTITVTMPQMGESVVEGTIESWLVGEGEWVEKDQTICEVTTDKVDAEIPAPVAGVITRLLAAEGATVVVDADIAVIDPEAARPAGAAPSRAAARPSAEGRGEALAPTPQGARQDERADGAPASPVARRMASERGLPLDQLSGSGPRGRVVKADVESFLERKEVPTPPRTPRPAASADRETLGDFLARHPLPRYTPREGDTVQPFSAIRRRIAEHMVTSKIVSPHVGTVAEVDLHALVALRNQAKRSFQEEHGIPLTYLPFVAQATLRALRDFPTMNATVVDQSVVLRAGIHIGVAVETERGLVVPVVRDAGDLSLVGLAKAIDTLAARARERKLGADDLQGGTFTLTNPGRQGNLYGFAVINQPQVGILRMGELKKRPVVIETDGDDAIAIRPMMYLALSYDHRIIDGVTGNGFLYRVARELEAADFDL